MNLVSRFSFGPLEEEINRAESQGMKNKGFPYLLPSIGTGADHSVQAVSLQVTISHPPGGRLPLFSARPAVTFPAAEDQYLLAIILIGNRGI